MKHLIVYILCAVLFSFCKSPGSTSGNSRRPFDTTAIKVIGDTLISVDVRKQVDQSLEGKWILESIMGVPLPESKIDTSAFNRKTVAEERRDTVETTETRGGRTRTVRNITIQKPQSNEQRITPPQGANYHIPEPPSINFYGSNETFSGFTGCNKFAGRYQRFDSIGIRLNNAEASTKMVCIGSYNEEDYLQKLRRTTRFETANGRLKLYEGETELLAFRRER